MAELLGGEFGYHIVFRAKLPAIPGLIHPQSPDFKGYPFWILAKD